jgi:hypothetical protein
MKCIERVIIEIMTTILNTAGAKAGIKNTPLVFRAPIESEARLINKRKGNIILVKRTVFANFSGSFKKPGAMAVTINGANIIPNKHTIPTKIRINIKTDLTSLFASAFPCLVWYSVTTGTNAEDIEPSAKSSLKRLGILKATKKVSALPVAPKNFAKIMSLM